MKYTDKKVTIQQIIDTFYSAYDFSIINAHPLFINNLLELSLVNEIKEETITPYERLEDLKKEYGSASVYLNKNNEK